MPGLLRCTLVTTLVCFIPHCTRGRGCIAPAFPAPSIDRGTLFLQNSGDRRRGSRRISGFDVIARSGATKQIHSFFMGDDNGLLRGACHRARIRATVGRMTASELAALKSNQSDATNCRRSSESCAAMAAGLLSSRASAIASSTRSSQTNCNFSRAPAEFHRSPAGCAPGAHPGRAGRGGGDDFSLECRNRQHQPRSDISPVIAVSLLTVRLVSREARRREHRDSGARSPARRSAAPYSALANWPMIAS